MKYRDYRRNYFIAAGRERALNDFLNQTYEGKKHKWQHRNNSNSEDALTWSCFEMLRTLPFARKIAVLGEVFEDAYCGNEKPIFRSSKLQDDDLKIYVGKKYTGRASGETTDFNDKWMSAACFDEYKNGADLRSLRAAIADITDLSAQSVADNMGWLTWGGLFKSILRGMV